MAVLSYKEKKALPASAFAIPDEHKYPIHDLPHARNALSRVSQYGSPDEKSKVRSKVYSRWEQLNKDKE